MLDRAEGVTQFTSYTTYATLTVAPDSDIAKARKLMERAEHHCLVANSLRGTRGAGGGSRSRDLNAREVMILDAPATRQRRLWAASASTALSASLPRLA